MISSNNHTFCNCLNFFFLFQEEKYVYEPPSLPFSLPAPSWDELETGGYLNHVRRASPQANAGGYTEHYACLRALQDFMGSYNIPSSSVTV